MSFRTSQSNLGSSVATGGTFTVAYPENTNSGTFASFGHKVWVDRFQYLLESPADFTIAFGASNITITYLGQTTIPADARVNVQLNTLGGEQRERNNGVNDRTPDSTPQPIVNNTASADTVIINLGAPDAADADGIIAAQDLTAAGVFSVDGDAEAAITAAALSGILDVPRALVAAWTGTATLTLTGTDEYGRVLVETSASGQVLAGQKAFKTITDVSSSADITGLTVGTSDRLGLPVFLPSIGYVIDTLEDGVAGAGGTYVAGDASEVSGSSADVRGTFDPASTADGTTTFDVIAVIPDSTYKGVDQFAG